MKLTLFISYLLTNKKPLLYNYIHHRKNFETLNYKNEDYKQSIFELNKFYKIDLDFYEKILDYSDDFYETINNFHFHQNIISENHHIINIFHIHQNIITENHDIINIFHN